MSDGGLGSLHVEERRSKEVVSKHVSSVSKRAVVDVPVEAPATPYSRQEAADVVELQPRSQSLPPSKSSKSSKSSFAKRAFKATKKLLRSPARSKTPKTSAPEEQPATQAVSATHAKLRLDSPRQVVAEQVVSMEDSCMDTAMMDFPDKLDYPAVQ